MSSNNSDKYELLTGEDLDLKPSTVEQAKFEYSSLIKIFNKGLSEEDTKEGLFKRLENIKGKNEELINRFSATNKAFKSKANNQSKILVYNTEHSFSKLKNISDIKKLSLDSMFNLMRKHHKKIISLKNVTLLTENNKKLKQEVLINAGGLYNSLYYIYKNKYNKKVNSLDTENRTKLDYKKSRLADDYEYPSEEEEEKTITDLNTFKGWIVKKEGNINSELVRQYFNYQTPSALFNDLHNLKDNPLKNNVLVHVIESGLIDLEKKKLKTCLKKK